jgi:hypothetical protein
VYFDTGTSDLNADGHAVVRSVAEMLAAHTAANVELTGYTDITGDARREPGTWPKSAPWRHSLRSKRRACPRQSGTMKPPVLVEVGTGGSDAGARRVEIAAAK